MAVRWDTTFELSERELARLGHLAATSRSKPFADLAVLEAWLHAAESPDLLAGVALDDGDLCGFLLLARDTATPDTWRLWGETIDFGVVWADPDRASRCWGVWLEGLRGQGVSTLFLRNLRVADPAVSALLGVAEGAGVRLDLLDRRHAPYVDLTTGHDGWLAARTASQRKQYRRAHRRFRELPGFELEVAGSASGVAAAVEGFFALHAERRLALGRTSVYDSSIEERFLRSLAARWSGGELRPVTVRSDGRLVGVELVIATPRTWYSLNGGWSPEFAAHHVGTGLLIEAMAAARDAGALRYSLLEGEEPYKMRMADGAIQLASWLVHLDGGRQLSHTVSE